MSANNQYKMKLLFGSVAPLSETRCSAAGFTNTIWRLWVSVNSGEVNLWKHSHPVIRLGLYKELSASTKEGRYFFFLKKEARLALRHVSLSLLRPPLRFSFLPLLSFVRAVDSGLGLKLKTFRVCLLVVSARLFPSFPGTASLTAFWNYIWWGGWRAGRVADRQGAPKIKKNSLPLWEKLHSHFHC